MSLRPVGRFNHFTEQNRPKLPPRGTVIKYRFKSCGTDPITKERLYQRDIKLPATCRFYDEEANTWVYVGMVNTVDQNGNPLSVMDDVLWFEPRLYNDGVVEFTVGGSAATDALLEYLSVASFVGTNPNRDPNVPVLIDRVDMEKDLENKRLAMNRRFEAYVAAKDLEGDELDTVAAVLGIRSFDVAEKKMEVMESAEKNPDKFLMLIHNPLTRDMGLCLQAIDEGILLIEGLELKWADNKKPVISLEIPTREGAAEKFAAFATSSDGRQVADLLQKLMDRKKQKTTPVKDSAPKSTGNKQSKATA